MEFEKASSVSVRHENFVSNSSEIRRLLNRAKGDGVGVKEAWEAVQELIRIDPTTEEEKKARAYGCAALAEASFSRNKVGTAIDWWQEAVDQDPFNAEYRRSFVAHGLLPAMMTRQALNEALRAANLEPDNPTSWRLVGHIHMALNEKQEAIEAFEKQIALDKSSAALYDRSELACELADWDTVEKNAKIMLDASEQIGNVYHQLGLMHFRRGEHEKAIEYWDKTLRYRCDNPECVIWNRSVALHSLGRYRQGWREHEARGAQRRDVMMALQTHRGVEHLAWNNEPPPARLHVSQEMGFGDAIAMARYLPILADRGYDVRYEVMDVLVDLMKTLKGVTILNRAPLYPSLLGVPEFDYHVPCLSLPKLFGTTVETIPQNVPYLKADPKKVEEYRAKLGEGPHIGFCWSSGIRTQYGIWMEEYGKRKTIPFPTFERLIDTAAMAGVGYISLQVGGEKGRGLIDLLPKRPTFADTAALVECLDLVITVDTSLAHLVGAIGKPFWLLMHTEGSWHWMAERPGASWNEKSPWYPSARLFRAKEIHKWDDVIERVSQEIGRYFDNRTDLRRVG